MAGGESPAILVLASSGWFPWLILSYWSFILGWLLMVFLEALPPPYLKRNRTRPRENSGCDSGAGIDFWSCPKLGPVYLEGWIFIPSPSQLIHQSLDAGCSQEEQGWTGWLFTAQVKRRTDSWERSADSIWGVLELIREIWVAQHNVCTSQSWLFLEIDLVSIIWSLLWSFSLCFFLLSYPSINHLLMTYYEAGTLMRARGK